MKLQITDEHRSMIASAFVAAYDFKIGPEENKKRSLCCGRDATKACAAIVGKKHAVALRNFIYDRLGCCGWAEAEAQEENEQYHLDVISELETL
jgi:hypothetical protein